MVVGSKILRIWSEHFCSLAYGLWKMSYPCCTATQLFHKLLGQACTHSIDTIDNRNHSFMIILTTLNVMYHHLTTTTTMVVSVPVRPVNQTRPFSRGALILQAMMPLRENRVWPCETNQYYKCSRITISEFYCINRFR